MHGSFFDLMLTRISQRDKNSPLVTPIDYLTDLIYGFKIMPHLNKKEGEMRYYLNLWNQVRFYFER